MLLDHPALSAPRLSASSGTQSVGAVVGEEQTPAMISGQKLAASPEQPELIVRSDNGSKAAHKRLALNKA